ncbi:MAG TPA: hypothetical protein VEA38_04160, partial [Terriglobales bacterium]|nr:hypothetical protein [Terriglobales bacterium]
VGKTANGKGVSEMTTISVPVPGFTCAHCGFKGPGVGYHPWHVARGLRQPLCADEARCDARWEITHEGRISPAVLEQLARGSGPPASNTRAA